MKTLVLNAVKIQRIQKWNPNGMLSNKKLQQIVTKLFIRGRKLNISLAIVTRSYFAVPKKIRLNPTHYFENFKQMRTSTNHI